MHPRKVLLYVVAVMIAISTLHAQDRRDSGEYRILSARYGTRRQSVDVTDQLRKLARRDLVFRMGNSTFGVDPDHGHVKTLWIEAEGRDGRRQTFEYLEGSTVNGSIFIGWRSGDWGYGRGRGRDRRADRDSGEYRILSARYGTRRQSVDVTDQLRQLARRDMVFRMGNSTFGIDPDHGHVKTLWIEAEGRDGRPQTFEYLEGSTVNGSIFIGWRSGDWGYGRGRGRDRRADRDSGEYRILSARYGTRRKSVDVTDQLRRLARRDLTFRMGNSTFGIDPDHGHVKTLWIEAEGRDGRPQTFEYLEGSTVNGSIFIGWRSGDWGRGRGRGRRR